MKRTFNALLARKQVKNKKAIEKLLIDGSKAAQKVAQKTLVEAKKNIGLF